MKKYKSIYKEDFLPNGKADDLTLIDIYNKHVKNGWKGSGKDLVKEYEMGIEVEKEHTTDIEIAKEIAKDHLFELPNYYTLLTDMEKKHEKV